MYGTLTLQFYGSCINVKLVKHMHVSSAILRPPEEVPSFVGMTSLDTSCSLLSVASPPDPSSKLKAFVSDADHHVIIAAKIRVGMVTA